MFAPLVFFLSALLSACNPAMMGQQSSTGAVGQSAHRRLVQSGDTIYETMPGSTVPDYTRPVRQLQPGETFVASQPYPTPTPHAQTLEEGEALENKMAREAEQKAQSDQDPAHQAQKEVDKIDNSIQGELDKAEGSN